jgi:hypothetical protein
MSPKGPGENKYNNGKNTAIFNIEGKMIQKLILEERDNCPEIRR